MTFEAATALAFDAAHDEFFAAPTLALRTLPANDPADPEAGWAARNPERAMIFLFVTPRDCAAVDELMAA